MKIGIDIRNIGKGRTGDEVVFFNLVKTLAKTDNLNEYRLFTDITDEKKLEEIGTSLGLAENETFEIISLKAKNKFDWNRNVISEWLAKHPVDVYHTQYITPFKFPVNIKLVTTIHDVSFRAYPGMIKFFDLLFLRLLIPKSLKRANLIIAVSEFTKNEIIKYYKVDPAKIEVVYNAVDDDFLKNKELNDSPFATSVIEKYSLPEKFIMYLGTLQPRKNLPVLIKAYAKIKEKLPDIKLLLCGKKDAHNVDFQIDSLVQHFSFQKDVLFSGFIKDVEKPAFYKSAQAFCFPSFYEGFGIPLLEAMSENVPVLASDIPAHREIGGDAVLYFDPKSPDNLSEKIETILTQPEMREELIKKGQKRLENFSWEKSTQKLLGLYQKMLTK